jgi:hypothetical protein
MVVSILSGKGVRQDRYLGSSFLVKTLSCIIANKIKGENIR